MRRLVVISYLSIFVVATVAWALAPATRPWDGHATLSPFEAVRYPDDATVEVQVAGQWYKLLALHELDTPALIAACKSLDEKRWQKRMEEDLVAVLTLTKHAPPKKDCVDLRVQPLTDGAEPIALKDVPMTEDNRQAIWHARQSAEALARSRSSKPAERPADR